MSAIEAVEAVLGWWLACALAGAEAEDGMPGSARLVHAVTNARVDSERKVFNDDIGVLQIDGMTH
jgi:hypothetical protein